MNKYEEIDEAVQKKDYGYLIKAFRPYSYKLIKRYWKQYVAYYPGSTKADLEQDIKLQIIELTKIYYPPQCKYNHYIKKYLRWFVLDKLKYLKIRNHISIEQLNENGIEIIRK